MTDTSPSTTYLKDYAPPAFVISDVALDIDVHTQHTLVTTQMTLERHAQSHANAPLVLDGDDLETLEVTLDGAVLAPQRYQVTPERLTIADVPDRFVLTTRVRIHPERNTQLMGLYKSGTGYFTQCEAEGFRRITWFIDRPDVMARYTTTIHADQATCPVLLSNGNLIDSGAEDGGRHFARWEDPFLKPSYLFAMVAAALDKLEMDFTTASGRDVKLYVFVEPGKLAQCDFAMESLTHAMRWDERVFGLELDLDQYMIVAVGDFNMGAMENKGLNIFNTKFVLASQDTATDMDYMMLDRVVAHEYFHNWTGNRVTCRDWFQLSLKEGLTVFRDQQYGGDRYSHAVQRIQEVRLLRTSQFPEDAGPMAHPVRPESYIEINNFYTATVYNKGAEVVRMIHTLLGVENFRRGMDLYFQRHDGQAVRTEEFVAAMQDASGIDLSQMQRWYSQAGTPVVNVRGVYDAAQQVFTLEFEQSCPPTPGQPDKLPFLIPVATALLDHAGYELPLTLAEGAERVSAGNVLAVTDRRASFRFAGVPSRPVPSLLRGFSAPVILNYDYTDADLAHLMAHDSDPFNRWEAGQRLAMRVILAGITAHQRGTAPEFPLGFFHAVERILADAEADPAFAAEALSLPNAGYIAEQMEVVDADAILAVRTALRREIATRLEPQWHEIYTKFVTPGPYRPDPAPAGRRSLRNIALGYLMELEAPAVRAACLQQLQTADNMTDASAALVALANSTGPERLTALAWFYDKWQNEPLVVDKWLSAQSGSRLPSALADVRALMAHPAFDLRNPNKVRALIGVFCHGNHVRFNAADGSGYVFAADQVIALDAINAQVAARLARAFDRWRRFDSARQAHAKAALERIAATQGLSRDTYEVVSRALQ